MTDAVTLPPLPLARERRLVPDGGWERTLAAAEAAVRARRIGRARPLDLEGSRLLALSDAGLRAEATALRRDSVRHPAGGAAARASASQALALAREAGARALGQRAYDVQMAGAHAALGGAAVEMATGEGKTLTAALAAAAAALTGLPSVHVVTANDYLAERDAALSAPLYRLLGLTSGAVAERTSPAERHAAYRSDVTVCTGKDLAFDYMRDRLRAGRRLGELRRRAARLAGGAEPPTLLRGLHFALVDEADSILIDEARTPLLLSADAGPARDPAVFDRALEVAGRAREGEHYGTVPGERRVVLLAGGRALLRDVAFPPPWDTKGERERLLELALTALHTLGRDEHYLIEAGRAVIVDEFTGRTMADRSWSEGLQELVERKEGLALSPRRTMQARMTYQRFFRRYRRLAGMSGTLHEVAGELWRIYRLPVVSVPTYRPDRKRALQPAGFRDGAAKWRAVAAEAARLHAAGAPVLIGTRTVAASVVASDALRLEGVPHRVLSAAASDGEAALVAAAGERGAVTVATNMAGRGTDIRLGPDVAALGGLHVLVADINDSSRIDRQLAGRCGRQGDPGAVRRFVALDDTLLRRHCPAPLLRLATRLPLSGSAIAWLGRRAQRRAERLHARLRADLMRSDEWLGDAIAFAGEAE